MTEATTCSQCGVVVAAPATHARWHRQQAKPQRPTCKRCKGTGKQPGLHNLCGRCGGSGRE